MPKHANAAVIERYFEACNAGDDAALHAVLDAGVVHYFLPGHPPVTGADALSRHWRKFRDIFAARWFLNRVIASGEDAVSEWAFEYRPAEGEARVVNRGTEWYVIRDGRIAEIRAYYIESDEPCALSGFPYAARGYLP
ncbi:MAG: nuclear transport factor 2 family protein [Betaproteobacteria bacterium]|nr:nuclear transport factor 2 family protein [Betaproteobacteria bacterium]